MNRLIIGSVFFLLSTQVFAQTRIIAHRGFSSMAPENTMIAFQKAKEINADYFELDVHKTKDDSLVVIHDSSIDKTSTDNMKGEIAMMNYHALSAVKVGYPKKFGDRYLNEKIPTLREALGFARGQIKVCIEIKVLGVEQEVLEIVSDLGMHDEVIIFSFHYPVLAKIRQLNKSIPILYLIGSADKTTIDYANVIGANAIGVGSGTILTKDYLDFAHQNGIEVWKYTVNEVVEMQQLIDIGLDGLITDFPNEALKITKRKN